MTPTIEADVKHEGKKGVAIRTPYSESFVAALKDAVPFEKRAWRERSHTWWVHFSAERAVEKLMLEYWPAVMRLGGARDGHVIDRDGRVAIQERLL
jgi:hypothetical protein